MWFLYLPRCFRTQLSFSCAQKSDEIMGEVQMYTRRPSLSISRIDSIPPRIGGKDSKNPLDLIISSAVDFK